MKNRRKLALCCILLLGIFGIIMSGCGKSSKVYLEEASEASDAGQLQEETAASAGESAQDAGNTASDASESESSDPAAFIYVHVCGAVVAPGVYRLSAGSRIFEAIELAGGLAEEACGESVNQAGELADGQMIRVLTQEEAEAQPELLPSAEGGTASGSSASTGGTAGGSGTSTGGGGAAQGTGDSQSAGGSSGSGGSDAGNSKVNINTADAAELMTLPGIGESKAASILSYREEHGSFGSVEELMNISGIKEGVYAKIKDYITVN